MLENESAFDFVNEAREFYDSLSSVDDIVGLWGQLAYIAGYGEADIELAFDDVPGHPGAKAILGPPFVIIFDNTLEGEIILLAIRRPRLRRLG